MEPAVPKALAGLARLAPLTAAALSQVRSREAASGALAERRASRAGCCLAAETAAAFDRRLRVS